MQNFRDLRVWSDAVDLSICLYETTDSFGLNERFGLISQTRRAAVSVAANIAEGAGSQHSRDFARFLGYSISSLCEVESHLEIAFRLDMISTEQRDILNSEIALLRKRLIRLHGVVADEATKRVPGAHDSRPMTHNG